MYYNTQVYTFMAVCGQVQDLCSSQSVGVTDHVVDCVSLCKVLNILISVSLFVK